jgi:hypothetical protein
LETAFFTFFLPLAPSKYVFNVAAGVLACRKGRRPAARLHVALHPTACQFVSRFRRARRPALRQAGTPAAASLVFRRSHGESAKAVSPAVLVLEFVVPASAGLSRFSGTEPPEGGTTSRFPRACSAKLRIAPVSRRCCCLIFIPSGSTQLEPKGYRRVSSSPGAPKPRASVCSAVTCHRFRPAATDDRARSHCVGHRTPSTAPTSRRIPYAGGTFQGPFSRGPGFWSAVTRSGNSSSGACRTRPAGNRGTGQ